MPAIEPSDKRHLNELSRDQRFACHIFDVGAAFFGGSELLGALFGGAEAAGLGAGALGAAELGPAAASITLPEVFATAPAIAAGGEVAGGLGVGAGALGAADLGGAAALGGGALGASALADGGLGVGAEGAGIGDLAGGIGTGSSGLAGVLSGAEGFGGFGAGPPDTLIGGGGSELTGGAQAIPAVGPAQPPPLTFAGSTTGAGGAGVPAPLTTGVSTPPIGAPTGAVAAGPTGLAPATPASVAPSGAETAINAGLDAPGIGTGDGPLTAAQGGDFGGGGVGGGNAATGAAKPEGFFARTLGADTLGDIKDAGSIIAPIAAIGGLGNALLNSNRPIPGRPQLVGLPNLAANTVAQTAGEARAAATGGADAAAKAASDAIMRSTGAATSLNATGEGQVAQGRVLENYVNTGQLPPGVANAIRSATKAAQASIRSQHAQRSTSGSSAEAQELQAAADRAEAAGTEVALKLLQQGQQMVGAGASEVAQAANLNLSGGSLGSSTALSGGSLEANTALGTGAQALNAEQLAQSIYTEIMNTSLAQDEQLSGAIGKFAAALAGGPSSITLRAA